MMTATQAGETSEKERDQWRRETAIGYAREFYAISGMTPSANDAIEYARKIEQYIKGDA